MNKATQNQNWEVLPPAKNDKQYSSYFFKPTLKSADPNDKVKNRDAFGYMLKNVKAAANQANTVVIVNKNIKELPVIRQKDVIYSDQTRATYNCTDFTKNEYALEPIIVIKKNRLDDLNIKSASIKRGPGYPTLCSDLRLSCSTENKASLPDPENKGVIVLTERIKERSSFEFFWMQLDMTVTQTE